MNHHPYRLRAYHNPKHAPSSAIPRGWRLLYADEAGRPQNKPCKLWSTDSRRFSEPDDYLGSTLALTYIVPIDA